ncbi:diguanylate cyclase [Desulfobotulus sp.]|jgi:diguanylate cyclase (GGDEF)-like protein|uniref:sensor domain-containing diguanylate cyclase n=1 Tax=Desulfobotulus sp. TaxID=1940337 RepID=UPI002A36BABE|nr:diguanylate cyclase [Desulfobotulus sp.]MDY0163916.1 diguanylate cyclase [Desulfobotulus sp.]
MKEKPRHRIFFRFLMVCFSLFFLVAFFLLSGLGLMRLWEAGHAFAPGPSGIHAQRFSFVMENPERSFPSGIHGKWHENTDFYAREPLHGILFLLAGGTFSLACFGGVLLFLGVSMERRRFLEAAQVLAQGMQKVRNGNFSCRVGEAGLDALEGAGRAFNEMAEALERSDRTRKALVAIQIRNNTQWIGEARRRQRVLAMHKARLEEKVKTRTSVLESMNTALRSSVRSLERRTLEITQLNRLAESLQNARNVEEAATFVLRTCQQIFPSDAGVLAFLNPAGRMTVMDGWGRNRPDVAICMGEQCPRKKAGNDRMEVCSAGVDGCEELCIPIRPREGAPAILRIRLRQMADLYGRKQAARRALAGSVAGHLTASLTTLHLVDRLRREAVTDPLTGLYNRRYMEETFLRELARVRREGLPLSVVLMDVDHFKNFNDTYGHEIGDAVLKQLADILKMDVRAEDVACRFGGEEFLLLMPGLSADSVFKRAETLRKEVENAPLVGAGMASLKVTMSLGVATYPGDGDTPQSLILEADKAMYAAKLAGRNRVFAARTLPSEV